MKTYKTYTKLDQYKGKPCETYDILSLPFRKVVRLGCVKATLRFKHAKMNAKLYGKWSKCKC